MHKNKTIFGALTMDSQRSAKAEQTRDRILQVAGEEMYKVGYRAMGLNDVLEKLAMSKGALYHHFKNKLELGYAILDELYAKKFMKTWVDPLNAEDPLQATITYLQQVTTSMAPLTLKCGCPINNLASEMSSIDEGFRLRVDKVYTHWKTKMTEAFTRAQNKGYMKTDVSADDTAVFVIATIQGAITLAKSAQDVTIFTQAAKTTADYLSNLQTKAV